MITLTREEAQQVLLQMERARIFVITRERIKIPEGIDLYDEAIETLRARLAEPELEEKKYTEENCPVCGYYCLGRGGVNCIDKPKLCGINTAPQQNQFNPDWDAMAVMVEEQQRMAKRIEELEAKLKEKNR